MSSKHILVDIVTITTKLIKLILDFGNKHGKACLFKDQSIIRLTNQLESNSVIDVMIWHYANCDGDTFFAF